MIWVTVMKLTYNAKRLRTRCIINLEPMHISDDVKICVHNCASFKL